MHLSEAIVTVLVVITLTACASRPINVQLAQADPETGYRGYLVLKKRHNNDPKTLFALSFSGGGTRAAALS